MFGLPYIHASHSSFVCGRNSRTKTNGQRASLWAGTYVKRVHKILEESSIENTGTGGGHSRCHDRVGLPHFYQPKSATLTLPRGPWFLNALQISPPRMTNCMWRKEFAEFSFLGYKLLQVTQSVAITFVVWSRDHELPLLRIIERIDLVRKAEKVIRESGGVLEISLGCLAIMLTECITSLRPQCEKRVNLTLKP